MSIRPTSEFVNYNGKYCTVEWRERKLKIPYKRRLREYLNEFFKNVLYKFYVGHLVNSDGKVLGIELYDRKPRFYLYY